MRKKLVITMLIAMSLALTSCGQSDKSTSDNGVNTQEPTPAEDTEPEEDKMYNELISEADGLVSTDYEQAVSLYQEAIDLNNEKEEAYIKLINLYIDKDEWYGEQSVIDQIEANIEFPSDALQHILNDEKQKNWYLATARSTIYKEVDGSDGAHAPVAGDTKTEMKGYYDYYFKYDDQGRLIESNAGSMPTILARNIGTTRQRNMKSVIDSDLYAARAGQDASYSSFLSVESYAYPDVSENDKVYFWSYQEDGSILETVKKDGELIGKTEYMFDNNNRLAYVGCFDPETSKLSQYSSDFKYSSDYVSYQNNSTGDLRTKYYEESYNSSGILTKYMIETEEASLKAVSMNTYGYPLYKLNFYFSDSNDSAGNITSRNLYYDIVGGNTVGRQLDGTYHEWKTLQTGLLSRSTDYNYVFCKPNEVNAKIASYREATETDYGQGDASPVVISVTPTPEAESSVEEEEDNNFEETVGMDWDNSISWEGEDEDDSEDDDSEFEILTEDYYEDNNTSSYYEEPEKKDTIDSKTSNIDAQSDDYIFSDSSTRLLTEDDVKDLSKETLGYARNEIFARHGYIFTWEEYWNYFSSKSWYKPTIAAEDFDTEAVLNDIEKANVDLIKQYEELNN